MNSHIHARRYDTLQPVALQIERGVIVDITPLRPTQPEALPIVAPGFFDLQINGYGGIWFSDADLTVEQVLTVLHGYFRHGITRVCPTLITASREAIAGGLVAIRSACEREPWAAAMVPGCHIEGPYISPVDGPRGAHPLFHVRGCDIHEFDEWRRASGNRVLLTTLAPEVPGAEDFIRHVTALGITVAIGHTAANTQQIQAAVAAGATLSTHLGNGCHPVLPRHPNFLWDQLAEPRLWTSLITDGHHIPQTFAKTTLLAKGTNRTIITCDASGLAGCPPAVYEYNGGRYEVLADGPIVVAGQRTLLAGSGRMTDACVGQMHAWGCSLEDACNMAAKNPARLLGQPVQTLDAGQPADLVVFDVDPSGRLEVQTTLAAGRVMYLRSR